MPSRPLLLSLSALRQYTTAQLLKPRSSPSSSPSPSSPPRSPISQPTSRHFINSPTSPPDRIYTQRKSFLYAYYAHLIQRSSLVLLFAHDNLSVPDTNRLRAAIKQVPVPPPPTKQSKRGRRRANTQVTQIEPALLTITRTGVFAALARSMQGSTSLAPFLEGQTAILTCSSLSPTYLSALLRTISRSLSASKRPEIRDKVVKQPYLKLVAGVLEGNRLVGAEELGRVSKLPELDTLRVQVVGLLEGTGRSLVGLLGQAGGGGLVRTLQGLEKDLGEKAGGASGESL